MEEEQSVSYEKNENELNDHGRKPAGIADTLAKMYHQENIKETQYGRQLRPKEGKTTKMMNDIIAASLKRIKKFKEGKLPQNESTCSM
jgi:hypothetical protein